MNGNAVDADVRTQVEAPGELAYNGLVGVAFGGFIVPEK